MSVWRLFLYIVLFSLSSPLLATVILRHSLTLNDAPKYPDNFRNFAYTNPHAPKGGDVRLSAFGTFDSLNPFLDHGTPANGLDQVFESLAQRSEDEAFSVYPLIAESFEYDPKHFQWLIFHLNPQARFSDGRPVLAEDVAFSFHALTEQGDPGYRVMFSNIQSVQILDPHQVRFVFKNQLDRTLPLLLASQLPILSSHYYHLHPFNQTNLNFPVGSGPYIVDSIDAGRSIRYRRNPQYWGQFLPINQGLYNFDQITYTYYRDSVVALEAFKAGQYDFRIENKAKNWARLYHFPAVTAGLVHKEAIANHNPAGMQGFVFNIRKSLFQDIRVREAIAQAFDFEWSNRFLFFDAYRRNDSYFANSELAAPPGPLSPTVADMLTPYRHLLPETVFTGVRLPVSNGHGSDRNNLIYAQTLLAKAGYKVKGGILYSPLGVPVRFEILSNQPEFDRIIEPFQHNLEKLGIHTQLRDVDISQYINRMRKFDFDMTTSTFSTSLTPGNELKNFWTTEAAHSPGSQNLAGVHSPVVDALVEQVLKAPNRHQLVIAARALDRVLMAEWYVIPQYYVDSYRVAYWDFLRQPAISPAYSLGFESWWIDTHREAYIRTQQGAQ